MSEIVKRLRRATLYEGHGELSALPEEAADEIERLAAEAVRLREALAARDAEVTRLRNAWARMSNTINVEGSPYAKALQAIDDLVTSVKAQTRAALSQKEST